MEFASSVGLHKKDLRCRARVEVFRVTCGSERVRDNTRTCRARATCTRTRATVFLLEKKVPVSLRHSQSFSDSFYYEGTCTRTVLYCSCTRTVRVRVHLYNVVRKYWKYLRKYLRRYVLSYESTFVLSYLRTHYTVQLQYRLHTTHVHSTRTVHVMYEDT